MKSRQLLFFYSNFLALGAACFTMSGCKDKKVHPITKAGKKKAAQKEAATLGKSELIAHLEKVVTKDPASIDARYQLAEAYMGGERYNEAADVFHLITIMNPSDQRVEYASYNEILARFNHACKSDINCDASELNQALQLSKNYLDSHMMNLYNQEVAVICKKCQDKLLDKTISTFNFYLRSNKIEAARATLEKIKTQFLAQDESLKPRILFLECKLAKINKNKDGVESHLSCLLEQHPDSEYTKMAASLSNQGQMFTQASVYLNA